MKKLLMLLAVGLLIASLAACGKKDDNNAGQTTDKGTTENGNADTGMDDGEDTGDTSGMDSDNDTDTDTDTATDDNTVENADDIADSVSSIEEVDHANVLKVNDGIYVGATLKDGTESSQELDEKIADKAKESADDANKVYVSTNPDFAKEIDDYSDKIRNGEPVEGLFEEVGDALRRIFPDAH